LTVDDVHQWNVWHGQSLPYEDYKKLDGRFASKFGRHGFPVGRTVAHFCKGTRPTALEAPLPRARP
jgi:beta-mannosidase